jgi:hypothetical protein
MGRPTEAELETALARAARMRERDEDEYFLAKSLLSHNYRLHMLQKVLEAAKHYLHSGLAPHEHAELVKAIAAAEKAANPAGYGGEDFGLE